MIGSVCLRAASSESNLHDLIQQGGYKYLTMFGVFTMYFIMQTCDEGLFGFILPHSDPKKDLYLVTGDSTHNSSQCYWN